MSTLLQLHLLVVLLASTTLITAAISRSAFYLGALTIVAANLLHPWLERRARLPQNQTTSGS